MMMTEVQSTQATETHELTTAPQDMFLRQI